eukprot:g18892.t1
MISTFPSVDFRDPAATDMTEKAKANLHWLYAHTTRCSFMLVAGDTRGCGIIPEISTPEDYSRLVLKAPRPYHLFVLFTNRGCCNLKRGHCKKDCEKAEAAFKQVAASYHILGEHEAPEGLLDEEGDSSATSDSPDPAAASDDIKLELRASAIAEQQPAFFAIVYCDEEAMQHICTTQKPSSGTAGKIPDSVHKLDTVPKLVHARGSTLRRKNGAITFKPQHVHQTVDWSQAEEMLSFVSAFAPREGGGRGSSGGGAVKLYEDLVARLRKMAPIVGVGLGVLAVVVLGAGLVRLLPWLMVVGACGVQWLGCSGITYNLIHGMKWHGDRGERISRSNRVQFLTEGLSCSALFMIGGLALVFAITLAQSRYRTRTAANFATLLACLSIGVSFASVWTLLNIYGDYKAGWYVQPGFAPPEGYRKGPVNLDRGLSFVNVEPKTFYEDSFVSLKDLWRTLSRAWSTRAGPAVSAGWPSLSLLFGSWSGDADIVHSTEQQPIGDAGDAETGTNAEANSSDKRSKTKKGRKKPKKVDEAPAVAGGTKMNRVTWSLGGQVAAAISGALDTGTWTKTLKKVKKAWGASRAVSATHELLVDAFDLLWAPVDWMGNLDSTWAAWTKSEKKKRRKIASRFD